MNSLRQWAMTQKKDMAFLFLFACLLSVTVIGQAYAIVQTVDAVFMQKDPFQAVVPMLLAAAFFMGMRAVLTFLTARTGVKMAARAKNTIRMQLLEKWRTDPVHTAIRGQSGEKVTVLIEAVDGVDSYFRDYMPQVMKASVIPIAVLLAVALTHGWSALIMMITSPFIPLFYIIIGIKTQKKSEEQLDRLTAFSGQFLDTLQGLQTLKLFGQAKRQRAEIEQSSLGFRDATMGILKVAFTSTLMLEFISTLSIGLIALEIGLRLVVFDSISFASAFFVLVLAPEYYTALKELGGAFHTGRGSMGAADKITKALNEPVQSVTWGTKPVNPKPLIELDHVSFQYGNGFSLKDVSLSIPSGYHAAIVGATGAGKTTLLHLIAGLSEPSGGVIRLDGADRRDVSELAWFHEVSYISQHPYLFSGTIADNIALGAAGDVSEEAVRQAAEQAGLTELLSELEHGLHTPVGEAGRGLSGGEKQRVALARAFLKQPSVVLFDEPTTGLDLKTEQLLQTSIRELSKQATVITVAHRLHTIQDADCIFFLNEGVLEAAGTHEELLQTSRRYSEMVKGDGA